MLSRLKFLRYIGFTDESNFFLVMDLLNFGVYFENVYMIISATNGVDTNV